ncbi:MAG: hypothetical protein JWN84_1987 [Nocardioides sp.]|jgi:hypothetical protein|nr:hypothetical protein [Nocardioides sp.]
MESLPDVLHTVVEPALRAVFAAHEVTSVHLFVAERGGYAVRVTVAGETYEDWVVEAGAPDTSLDDWSERLRSNLVDFVAESRFGWGQDREHGPPA